jgi:hypothetical protein
MVTQMVYNPYKVYLKVEALFFPDGTVKPVAFWWEDGRRFEIDKVLDVRCAASTKAGGHGTRFTCRVRGREVYLFLDDTNRWFMARKQ